MINILNILLLLFFAISGTWAQCRLDTSKDFGTNSPLLLNSNGGALYPDRRVANILNFNSNQAQQSYCPGATVEVLGVSSGSNTLRLTCSSGTRFQAPTTVREFSNVRCNRVPVSTTRETGNCPNGRVVEIGFQATRNIFSRTIDLCWNSNRGRTTWAHAVIPGAISGRQTVGQNPGFRVAGFYDNIPVVQAYTRASQRSQLSQEFGMNQTLVDRYIPTTGEHFLARGHLIARADMYYTAQQDSTFYYINVLPMWQSINNGNWKIVEDNVRSLARDNGDLDVWAGSLYDLELIYTPVENRTFFLESHRVRGSPVLMVPRLLFKVAYHRPSNRAVVFVTANNPYLVANNIPGNYRVCPEHTVCRNNFPQFNNIDRGYTYCCLYNDFIQDGYASNIGLPNLGNVGALL